MTRGCDKRRVALWVVPVANLGGVARHVLDVARAGIPGWALEVAAPEGPLLERLRDLGIPCHPVPLDGSPVAAVRALRRVLGTLRPDVVHSHLARADFLVAAATIGLPMAVVSTEHGIAGDDRLYNPHPLKSRLRKVAHHLRCARFDALVAVSASTAAQMRRAWRPRTPITVIPNGVDRPAHDRREPGWRFLSLARLSHEKNIAALVDAFALVHRDHPGARLTIGGEGPDLAMLQARARAAGVGAVVDFPGFLDATAALESHDVIVQLSAWENASYTLLDAAVHGLGVVATPVGGNPEILPARCLAAAEDTTRVAELMASQAQDISQRPALDETWPTIGAMTAQVAAVYDTHREGHAP